MNDTHPFRDLPFTVAQHFRLYCYSAVLRLIESLSQSFKSSDRVFELFPFLESYVRELLLNVHVESEPEDLLAWWFESLAEWEEQAPEDLPLRLLSDEAGLGVVALTVFFALGLVDEDPRFAAICESLGGPGQRRWTFAALSSCWSECCDVRAIVRRLQRCGMATSLASALPGESVLQANPILWDALRGDGHLELPSWALYRDRSEITALDRLTLPPDARETVRKLPALFADGSLRGVIIRGPHHNGRRTLAGAVARECGRGSLFVSGENADIHEHVRLASCVATALRAMLTIAVEVNGGETIELPATPGYSGAMAIVMGKQGGVAGEAAERALAITLRPPGLDERRVLWADAIEAGITADVDSVSERFHLTSGNIRRAAPLAAVHARLDGRSEITARDVKGACRTLVSNGLERFATRLDALGGWSSLAAPAATMQELYNLESRCRHRDRLSAHVGSLLARQTNHGVRALFKGASGTGKSLAARLLAGALELEIFRIDLTIVNKYIGETEKALEQIFCLAEELDVMLLLDEGDALLTQRTGVQSSIDRYANLETNYLLQRMESFTGILIVTTNAVDRVDSAFQRRMDVIVDFRPPDAPERWAIWQLHLPPSHEVDPELLSEVAGRCELTGGQIRNAVLHATSLALGNGGHLTSEHLAAAVRREYRKSGAACPLRRIAQEACSA